MCGILFVLSDKPVYEYMNKVTELVHRGPDAQGFLCFGEGLYYIGMGHTHLCINGTVGSQPFNDENYTLIVNGEIYNALELCEMLGYESKTRSDCEVIMPLYSKYKLGMFKYLRGQFSFVLLDKRGGKVIVSRDLVGITSLYEGMTNINGNLEYWVSSEVKVMSEVRSEIRNVIPGSYIVIDLNERFKRDARMYKEIKPKLRVNCDIQKIEELLVESVGERLRGLRPETYGFLLSGGLDSSVICAIGAKLRGRIKTFSIGLEGSPDLEAAREVAKYLNSYHKEYVYTVGEGIQALKDVVRSIETYDITTIRASTPMYILGRNIRRDYPELKVLLSGEGSDELFGGYLYFRNAPSGYDFSDECIERVRKLHVSDCLRAHKSLMAHNLECRVPFLEEDFMNYVLSIHPIYKMHTHKIEKYILREAFRGSLPDRIIDRQKDQMSDAVGYNWISGLREFTEGVVMDSEVESDLTKEGIYYKKVFRKVFSNRLMEGTIERWKPKWSNSDDPSGLCQEHHSKHNEVTEVTEIGSVEVEPGSERSFGESLEEVD